MAKDDHAIRKDKDDGNTKSNKKDASPDVSMLRRSGRGTSSMEQATPSPLSARKSARVGKQTSPSPSSVKKKKNIIEKTMSPSPLRRSNRGKTVIEVPALLTVKSKKGKSANSSKEIAVVDNDDKDNGRKDLDKSANSSKENVVVNNEDKDNGRKDLDSGNRKRKRFNARIYKALFIPQRIRIDPDDDDSEGQDNLEPDISGDKDLLVSLGMIDVDKEVKDRDVGVGKCNGEANDQSDAREPDCRQKLSFTEEHQVSPSNGEVQGSPDIAPKAFFEGKSMDLDQEDHIICSLQTIPLDGKSTESGNVEKQIGGNFSPSNRNIADSDNHIPHTSSLRINHDLENQQELDSCDKVTGMSKVASVMESAENKVANTNTQNGGSIFNSSKFVEFWVPVKLSNVQLEQYCATLLSNDMALRSSSRNDSLGALKDTFLSSRKCCNHPYLVDPRLQNLLMKNREPTMLLDVGIKASGKLHFLDLVLPEIKKRQLRVIILFQPTSGTLRGSASASIGDILVDFVHQRFGEDSYEHIDGFGNVHSKKKEAAVNIFNKDKSRFIFLLESRACHPKLKLSSVDIIIVFDSDLNPANDLRALQKIHINSHSQQIKIFRLNSSSTVEEKILKLAEQSVAVDITSNLRSTYDALLTWGASELFNKLTGFHKSSVDNISSEESFLKDVVEEFTNIISHISKSKNTSRSIITRVQNCGIYGMNIPLHSELKAHILNGDQPHIFWKTLLEGKFPKWKFVSLSTPRERKRPRNFAEPLNNTNPIVCGVKARKKTVNINNNTMEQPVQLKAVNAGDFVIPVHNESQSSFGDHFWSTEVTKEMNVINEMNNHNLLKLTVSELCNNLKFSEDVKDIVKRFLKFVLENYRVSEGPPSTLQAFMIAVCWIGSALANFKIHKRKSVGLAKKFMNFSCVQEEVFSVYSKLEVAKQTFLQHNDNRDILTALKECTPSVQEPRMSQSVSVNLQDARPENCDPSNEKTLRNNECETQKEIDEFNRKWDQKMANLVNDYEVDKALIRSLHRSTAVRSEKLKNLDKDCAYKKELLEQEREIHLKNLKLTLLAAKTHVAADNELHSHHETQMATTSRNPIEAQSNGVDSNIANVREGDGANDMESTGSHKQIGEATVLIEPIGKRPAQQQDDMEIEVAGKVDSVEVEENAKGGSSSPKDVGVPAGNRNERNADCTSQSVGDHNDSCGSSTLPSTASDHTMPTILEIQSDSLQQVPHSGTQNQEKQADLNPMVEVANDNLQPLEAGQLGQIISQDPSLDSHDELSIPLHMEYSNGDALQPENDQEDEDPLKAELKQLRLEEDNIIKSHKENKQRLKSECAKEIAKAITEIRLKYNAKNQEADAVFSCKKKEIEANLSRVELNEALAVAFRVFRQKCTDLTHSGNSRMQQVSQAGLAQQMQRRSGLPVTRHSPGQSSGGHQNTPPPQPLHQIADQPSVTIPTPLTTSPNNNHTSISSTTPTRPPPAINSSIPSTIPATSRQPPAINPIIPSSKPSKSPPSVQSIMSAANARINAETGTQASHIQPIGNSEVRARAPHMRPLASGELRTPAPHMRPLASSEIRAPAPHLRPLASSEIRAPAPHLRPLASSEIRAPAPHLRPLASSEILKFVLQPHICGHWQVVKFVLRRHICGPLCPQHLCLLRRSCQLTR
ncbi:P-loop containing nucleoside triphosphate hydrolase [Artemisia annua]|uniref:P-loop containing nucleoside triphosphate hydrolase n=1 Tax=Artemisia annua TaxID=35608 RepID=A0A2U1QG19_ARTAN|nr:P-loop containing nucleoside triphosphate hydrolase [Artemisia annua]